MNMTRIIRNTVYQVKVYNDRQDDIILRLILNQPTLRREPPAPTAALEKAIV